MKPAAMSGRSSAKTTLAVRKPILEPQSNDWPSYLTPVNGCACISVCIASVSWISPPAPRGCSASRVKISGCRM